MFSHVPRRARLLIPALIASTVLGATRLVAPADSEPIIRRTEYGVPHISANDFRGIGIGLGYAQAEDYGVRVILSLIRSKGWMGRTFGRDSLSSDFSAALEHARVEQTYHVLDADTRDMYDGFAEGVNRYIRANAKTLPTWAKPVFHGHDVAAGDIGTANVATAERLVARWLQRSAGGAARPTARDTGNLDVDPAAIFGADADVGSNAWALAPSRTKSGRAILLRNPHLAWTAGYWEAHVTVPGKLDFYGDFRIGSAFSVIGGFNKDLGWATTNNAPDLDEVYELDLDPTNSERYRFDGTTIPIRYESVTLPYRSGGTDDSLVSETRRVAFTPLGPVVHRTASKLYIVRAGPDGEYRAGSQFLAMMRARNLAEWKSALATRARATSNLTYADRAGNILTIWMGTVPHLPTPSGGDSVPIPARGSADVWTRLIALDSLPQSLNPRGGYVHNENDAPHFANLNALLDTARYPDNVERGELRLRSQHALQLIGGKDRLSLEDVLVRKHSMRMLLADRVKPDLVAALKKSSPTPAVAQALAVLEKWDNTVAPTSRGGLLFETWWRRYQSQARDSAYAEKWSWQNLTTTPRGIGQPARAVDAFSWAVDDMQRRYKAVDVAWGDVHRVRRGSVNEPVGGCSGALGCFRVLSYEQRPDGTRNANSGDGWILAVEFGPRAPRAFSVLAYGQSADSTSPHYSDQAAMFARGQLKPVYFLDADIAAHTLRSYRPEP
ncbi:penicillin acylase family protein [Gemmatimonas sp.]|uniref:penicillin acylase family protein n=1 Tax=Gemmatimonas sp. TaxID=1962908 RepID=UPI00286DEE8B|nr:penicillin acylase family protein [Gemmatimonas sp.]